MIFPTLLPNLHGIACPTPFDVGQVNLYLAEGDPLTLIDCGTRTDDAYNTLVGGLAELGYQVGDIRRVLITHHHVDHIGLSRRIAEESGAEIWAHPYAVPWIEAPVETRSALAAYAADFFLENGVPQSIVDLLAQVDTWMNNLTESAAVSRTMNEGDLVTFAGYDWQLYHTPGHAGSMLCFYQLDSQILISSDHLIRDVSSNPLIEMPDQPDQPRPRRLIDYLHEMQRIARLDVRRAYAGHGEPFDNIQSLVESRVVFHQKRADKLLALFEGQARSLYDLTQLMFPKVPDVLKYLTLSEVQGHLDLLEEDGRVIAEPRHGVVIWKPV